MRISNYPTDTITGTEMILASNFDTSTQKYATVNFTADTLKTYVLGALGGTSNSVVFEGSETDDWQTTLTTINPTVSDKEISLPNVSGTLPVLAVASTTPISATPEEINILDGATLDVNELNIFDGITSTTAELNILDGVTATAAELNLLDGVTSTAAELNLLDGSIANTVVNSKAVIYGSSGEITGTFTGNITGDVTGNTSGTAATVTTAAQPAITSLGTLVQLVGGTGDFNWDSNTLAVDSSENRVGIGTATPGQQLHIYSGPDAATVLRLENGEGSINLIHDGGIFTLETGDTYALRVDGSQNATFAGTVKATQYKLSALNTAPSSASDTGTLGEIRVDASYIYVCTATNTWKRSQIATW